MSRPTKSAKRPLSHPPLGARSLSVLGALATAGLDGENRMLMEMSAPSSCPYYAEVADLFGGPPKRETHISGVLNNLLMEASVSIDEYLEVSDLGEDSAVMYSFLRAWKAPSHLISDRYTDMEPDNLRKLITAVFFLRVNVARYLMPVLVSGPDPEDFCLLADDYTTQLLSWALEQSAMGWPIMKCLNRITFLSATYVKKAGVDPVVMIVPLAKWFDFNEEGRMLCMNPEGFSERSNLFQVTLMNATVNKLSIPNDRDVRICRQIWKLFERARSPLHVVREAVWEALQTKRSWRLTHTLLSGLMLYEVRGNYGECSTFARSLQTILR